MSFSIDINTYLDEAVQLSLVRSLLKQHRSKRIVARLESIFRQLQSLPDATASRRGDRIYFPYDISPEQHQIEAALENTPYRIKDYKAGIATDGYGRDVRLGKVLQKLKKSFLLDLYSDDQTRLDDASSMRLVFSKHPYDIATMSSGRRWSSCMSLLSPTGEVQSETEVLVGRDIKQGVFVCYLIRATDTNIQNPLARLLMKPYVRVLPDDFQAKRSPSASQRDDEDVVYLVANQRYGLASSSFRDSVLDIIHQVQPERYGTFKLSKSLYCNTADPREQSITGSYISKRQLAQLPTNKSEVEQRIRMLMDQRVLRSWYTYVIHDDLSVDVVGDVVFDGSVTAWNAIPLQFGQVTGSFHIENSPGLVSLRGAPHTVTKNFMCVYSGITTLEGGPSVVYGYYTCHSNRLVSLSGAPQSVLGFDVRYNYLKSLADGPTTVSEHYLVEKNSLSSLVGAPSVVKQLNVSRTLLRDFMGSPSRIDTLVATDMPHLLSLRGMTAASDIKLADCLNLKSLRGLPSRVEKLTLHNLPAVDYTQFTSTVGSVVVGIDEISSGRFFNVPPSTKISNLVVVTKNSSINPEALSRLTQQFPSTKIRTVAAFYQSDQ